MRPPEANRYSFPAGSQEGSNDDLLLSTSSPVLLGASYGLTPTLDDDDDDSSVWRPSGRVLPRFLRQQMRAALPKPPEQVASRAPPSSSSITSPATAAKSSSSSSSSELPSLSLTTSSLLSSAGVEEKLSAAQLELRNQLWRQAVAEPGADRESFSSVDLEKSLEQISMAWSALQQQIQRGEEVYWEETAGHGSHVFRGWDGFMDTGAAALAHPQQQGAVADAAGASYRRMPADFRWCSGSARHAPPAGPGDTTTTTHPRPSGRRPFMTTTTATELLAWLERGSSQRKDKQRSSDDGHLHRATQVDTKPMDNAEAASAPIPSEKGRDSLAQRKEVSKEDEKAPAEMPAKDTKSSVDARPTRSEPAAPKEVPASDTKQDVVPPGESQAESTSKVVAGQKPHNAPELANIATSEEDDDDAARFARNALKAEGQFIIPRKSTPPGPAVSQDSEQDKPATAGSFAPVASTTKTTAGTAPTSNDRSPSARYAPSETVRKDNKTAAKTPPSTTKAGRSSDKGTAIPTEPPAPKPVGRRPGPASKRKGEPTPPQRRTKRKRKSVL